MRGIFSAVRALEDMCIVPPLVGAIHRRTAAGGAKPGARRTTRPRRCSATCGSRRHRRGTAPFWPSSSCPGSASGESVSRRQSAPSTCWRTADCLSTAQSRVAPGEWHRRPLFRFGMAWASYLSEYCKRHDLPTDQPIFSGGEAVLKDYLTTLLHGSRWSDYARHSHRRGRAASCWNQKPGRPYFKWWGGWASTGVAMRYVTSFLDHGVLASLALPCPGTGVEEPPVVNCLSLWGSAMFGADAVEESLDYVGAALGPALPHRGTVADEPHATTAALLAMNRTILLQALRAPAPVSHPTRMSRSSSRRWGKGPPQTQPSESAPRNNQQHRATGRGDVNVST